nr:MAG TPA: hypothetical protein [Caudoviricetes sp.]
MESKKLALKDGIVVERHAITLNVNKNRRYSVSLGNRIVARNLLYCDIKYIIDLIRNTEK